MAGYSEPTSLDLYSVSSALHSEDSDPIAPGHALSLPECVYMCFQVCLGVFVPQETPGAQLHNLRRPPPSRRTRSGRQVRLLQ